jgi:hypothetical protein
MDHIKDIRRLLVRPRHWWQIVLAIFIALAIASVVSQVTLWLILPFGVVLYVGQVLFEASPPTRVKILILSAVAGVVACVGSTLTGWHDPLHYKLSLDDATYYVQAKAIAEAWHRHFYPVLHAKGSEPYFIGSLHTGYQRLLAAIFLLVGPNFRFGIYMNVIAVCLIPIFAYRATWILLSSCGNEADTGALEKGALFAALLGAVYPAYGFWSSWLLKDVILAVLFAMSTSALLDLSRSHHRPEFYAFAAVALTSLGLFRVYAALSVMMGAIVHVLAVIPRKWTVALVLSLTLSVVITSYSDAGGLFLSQLLYSLGALLPESVKTTPDSLLYFAQGIPRLLLAPYAWVKARGPAPMYELYPAMWVLYLVGYPMCILGFRELLRRNVRPAAIPLIAWFSSALILLMAYGGDAPRQRLYMDFVVFVLAGCGIMAKRRFLTFLLCYTVIAIFAAIQLLTLHQRV